MSDPNSDVELRLVDASRNRYRVYGLTECRTLFGELCLRIVWGRIGHRRLRERSEVFDDRSALVRRREELLRRRRQHGYVSTSSPRATARQRAAERAMAPVVPSVEGAFVEQHGLALQSPTARRLVERWHAATLDVLRYLEAQGTRDLDLVDTSTLAAMFVAARALASRAGPRAGAR